ncbi:FecR domain-containing protein [Paraburkholderia sp. BL6669N2]|uniref:FecR domain-containing protein n=1 Tax=Paraburkholderia sp. BL6669N2 TaxID=1938807 RepID=UPI0015F27D9D|nr:FecR domain-containing protein [Paraburkholderia sp. BL6669N2]
MGLVLALAAGVFGNVPQAGAKADTVIFTYSPGKGIKPTVQTVRDEIESGRRIATGAAELREVLFPDGTSVTVAPNSEVSIDAFDYQGGSDDRLTMRMDKGLIRIAGGALNEKTPIVVKTASGDVHLEAASAVIAVSGANCTRASLLVGREVDMVVGGQTQDVRRPGYEVVSACQQGTASETVRQEQGEAARDAFELGTAQLAGLTQPAEDELGRSGLSGITAAGASTLALATEDKPTGYYSYSGFQEIGPVAGGDGTGGFGSGLTAGAPLLAQGQPSESNGAHRSILQYTGNVYSATFVEPTRRTDAPTTNRFFNSVDAFSTATETGAPKAIVDTYPGPADARLQYVFWTEPGPAPRYPGIELLSVSNQGLCTSCVPYRLTPNVLSSGGSFDTKAPFMIQGVDHWPGDGNVASTFSPPANNSRFIPGLLDGSIYNNPTHWEILQAGFTPGLRPDSRGSLHDIVSRRADNFILFEITPAKWVNGIAEEDPTSTARFIFATGNVDGGRLLPGMDGNPGAPNPNFTNTFAVDRFFISAGLENFSQKDQGATVASGIRAFLRTPTALGLPLTDSGLYVINTGSNTPPAQTAFLHTDFGMQGTGEAQQSTISVTIGDVQYVPKQCLVCGIQHSYDAIAQGNTIASSHGNAASGQPGTVAISSPLMSTSFGGGNPQINRPGYAGYFVLENYTPAVNNVDNAPSMPGGTEHALGGANTSDVNYAILRLATGTGQASVGSRSNATLTGWAGGIAEKENGLGNPLTLIPVGTGIDPSNFAITTDTANNRLHVNLQLSGHPAMTLGASTGQSAFIDDSRFAAANGSVAMVNANLLRDSSGSLPASLNMPNGQPIPNYSYLQWGFFFGDTGGTAGTDLEHLHLGVWVAGREADPGQLPNSGSATYSGFAMGQVTVGKSVSIAVGSFDNTWNFAQRAGVTNMNFDGVRYSGLSRMRGGVVFDGPLSNVGANRAGSMVGNFVQAADGSTPAGGPPPAMAGRFVLQETSGASYRAAGVFGAQRH